MNAKEMEQKEYSVAIYGCHEGNVVTVYLTEDELRAVNKVNDALEQASNGDTCLHTLDIEEVNND